MNNYIFSIKVIFLCVAILGYALAASAGVTPYGIGIFVTSTFTATLAFIIK